MSVWEDNPWLEPRLRTLVSKGWSAGRIAKELKVTRNTVIGKVSRLGLGLAVGSATLIAVKRRDRVQVGADHQWHAPSEPRRFSWQDQPNV